MKINDILITKTDFIARFLYSRCPIIRSFLHLITSKIYKSDNQYFLNTFQEIQKIFKAQKIDYTNKTMLELGPGNNQILGLCFLLNGASDYIGIDKFPRISKTIQEDKAFIEKAFDKKLTNTNYSFLKNSATNMCDIKSNSIDIILSVSVLEHIDNIEDHFKEAFRVLKEGGIYYASVDLRDHFNFKYPFLFLKYSNFIYENFLSCPGYSYTNRLRHDAYLKIIAKSGFKTKMVKTEIHTEEIDKKTIHKTFKKTSETDLKITQSQFLLEK